ncbi:hypothetical protein FNH05_37525 [Amycolatopsis rhizosphaerae]|uniref:DUF559 domain-containing protein n=2 Tax=Amycolatopsis rhizosphaerae TaxID=2053003 RepID=A0A557ZP51_9PSEU|nr:hypothetical protein FNH05_37525 [Amycolatopsis rhizosphaerae]
MDSKTIWRRCQPGGPWRRLLPGIILLENGTPTDDQRIVAALVYAGATAMITGSHACLRHGLRRSELPGLERVHVLISHEKRRVSSEFLTVERTAVLPCPVIRNGVPLAPLVRATTDAARRLRERDSASKLFIEAIQRGRCVPAALLAELNAGTKRGTALPRRILSEVHRLRSVAELHAKVLGSGLDVPPSHWNVGIVDSCGNYLGRPDGWWDDVALAWEIDSVEFHYSPHDYARTLERNSKYAGAGIIVVQTLPSRLQSDPGGALAELKAAYAAAKARPRPAVKIARPLP